MVASGSCFAVTVYGLSANLLSTTLPGQRLFNAFLLSRLHVIRMFSDFLDNVFLLNLPLEAPQSAIDRLAFVNLDLSQSCASLRLVQ
jgi:hypothetical protein